jgi:hypothetical protein
LRGQLRENKEEDPFLLPFFDCEPKVRFDFAVLFFAVLFSSKCGGFKGISEPEKVSAVALNGGLQDGPGTV